MDLPHTFTGNPLDRAARQRRDPAWLAARLGDPASRVLPFRDLRPLVADAGGDLRLAWRPAAEDRAGGGEPVLLGIEAGGAARFAVELGPGAPESGAARAGAGTREPPADRFADARAAAMRLPPAETAILAQARSLLAWHATHRFCSRCGGPTASREGGYARSCLAPGCGASHFPRTDPVVIMLVHRGDRALLGRSVRVPPFPPGLYSCLAGYMEPGESLEEAVRREIEEESGVRVGVVRYLASQPWPFPSSLMLGCLAEAESDEIRVDPAEVETAGWFSRKEVRAGLARWAEPEGFRLPPPITAAHRLAAAWLDGASARG